MRPYHAAALMPTSVAIAVVSWNTRDALASCLRSIEPEVRAGTATVTVVDNASDDSSAELVREQFPWAELIASPSNLGFGAAANLAARRSSAPWIAVANADIELTPGALAALLAAGERDASAGILAPRLVLPDGSTQHSVYPFPTLGFTLAFNIGLVGLFPALADRHALQGRWDPERARPVDWAIGAFLLVRRGVWERTGGFDPSQWMYAEDLDLGWRAARAGWHTRYEPAARVRHAGAASTSQAWGDARQERWVRSTYGWMLRRRGAPITRSYALLNLAGALARGLLLTPPAMVRGGEYRARRRAMLDWSRLHLTALLSSRSELERQR